MPKAGHLILAIALPVISIVISIVNHNKEMDKIDRMFSEPSPAELERLQTYHELKPYIDSVLIDRSIAKHADSLAYVSAMVMLDGNYERTKEHLNRIFIDSLFAYNNYSPVNKSEERLKFLPGGTMIGLEDFNEFKIEDYFSPINDFGGYDVISFSSYKGNSGKYNWRFSGDTLILTKFKSFGDSYELETESHRYIAKARK